jgi:hemerythrin superfamily protein
MPATRKRSTGGRRTTTSKATGRQKNLSGSGKDAIALLKQDHDKVRSLFKRLESAAHRGGGEDILNQIEMELKVHTQIEEEIFYPAFKEAVEGKKDEHLYYEAVEEHHVVDMVMPEAKATEEGSDEFAAKGKVLKDIVEHHAEEEETQMFPKARRAMGMAQLRELGQQLQQRKEQLMGGSALNRGMSAGRGAISRMFSPITGGRTKKTTTNGRNKKRAA